MKQSNKRRFFLIFGGLFLVVLLAGALLPKGAVPIWAGAALIAIVGFGFIVWNMRKGGSDFLKVQKIMTEDFDFERYLKALNLLMEQNGNNLLLTESAKAYWMQGNLEQAKRCVEAVDPSGVAPSLYDDTCRAEWYSLRAAVCGVCGEMAEAAQWLDRTLSLPKKEERLLSGEYDMFLGIAAYSCGRMTEAANFFCRAQSKQLNDPNMRYLLNLYQARIARQNDLVEDAQQLLNEVTSAHTYPYLIRLAQEEFNDQSERTRCRNCGDMENNENK